MLDEKALRPRIIRAIILTVLAIALVLVFHFPVYYAIILIAFFWIRVLPLTEFIDKKILEFHPSYGSSHHLIRRAIPYMVYIVLMVAMKLLVVDIIASEFLHLPVKEQLYEFLNIEQP